MKLRSNAFVAVDDDLSDRAGNYRYTWYLKV